MEHSIQSKRGDALWWETPVAHLLPYPPTSSIRYSKQHTLSLCGSMRNS